MQIKNRKIGKFFIFLNMIAFSIGANAAEFNITANEVLIDKDNKILIGVGSVTAIDEDGNIIKASKITYNKDKEFLLAEENVEIYDLEGNTITSDKATFDKKINLIATYDNTKLITKENYKLKSKNITYDVNSKLLSSSNRTILTDVDGNIIEATMFQYNVQNNIFTSIGKIKVTDIKKNKYFFKELHIDTNSKEIVGSDVSVVFNQENFGIDKTNDPRLVANVALISNNVTSLSKGAFTVCKKRENKKCPPWLLKAKSISHDKIKKTIHYEQAVLKLYGLPIFYFPKFFHPDPTVERQSGLLAPFFTNNNNTGSGFALPYFWAMSHDKDLTFTPKLYSKENPLFLNEYRQAFVNGFLTLDTSYNHGYKNTSTTKTGGSRNHLFGDLKLDLAKEKPYQSTIDLKFQRASNDTYFKAHDINTALVNSEIDVLENEFNYNFSRNNMFIDINANVYETLGEKHSDRYEYILPNVMYGKTFFTEKLGRIDFKSNAIHNSYATNKQKTFLTNDIVWNPLSYISKNGFISSLEGMIRNENYETKKTGEFKDDRTINEINGVVGYKASLPMKKDVLGKYTNLFSPNFMLRYAPGHMRNLKTKNVSFNHSNLYALNKTSGIEDGLSAILGMDFKINEKNSNTEREKLSVSLGQVFNYEENDDMPSKSSLDQKMSDVVGVINYNFSEIGKIDYQFALDHNLNDLNYNDVSTELNFGKVQFNLDYLEQQNHVGNEHYASSGITLNLNEHNKLGFSTKKNFKTDSTELYNLSYQYGIDCLTAGVVYRREFYDDVDALDKRDSLMFNITFVPFGKVKSPNIQP